MMIKISLLKYTIRLEKCEYSIDTSIKFLYNNKIFATVKFLYTNGYRLSPLGTWRGVSTGGWGSAGTSGARHPVPAEFIR